MKTKDRDRHQYFVRSASKQNNTGSAVTLKTFHSVSNACAVLLLPVERLAKVPHLPLSYFKKLSK